MFQKLLFGGSVAILIRSHQAEGCVFTVDTDIPAYMELSWKLKTTILSYIIEESYYSKKPNFFISDLSNRLLVLYNGIV